jgi:hypothetical protein
MYAAADGTNPPGSTEPTRSPPEAESGGGTRAAITVVGIAAIAVTAWAGALRNRFVVTAQFAPPNTTTATPETVLVGTAR